MYEARQFLRYVLPGAAASIEFLLLIFLTCHFSLSPKDFLNSRSLTGLAAFALLAFAALGYIFSNIHHLFLWKPLFYKRLRLYPDYRPLFRHAGREGWLRLIPFDSMDARDRCIYCRISQQGAWRFLNALWHERIKAPCAIKSANPRAESLSDIVHGAGAMFAGSVIAVLAWICVYFAYRGIYVYREEYKFLGFLPFWVPPLLLAIFLLVLHFFSLRTTLRHADSFVQIVLGDVLRNESSGGSVPVQSVVTKRDLVKD
jgi:hypothetical protein